MRSGFCALSLCPQLQRVSRYQKPFDGGLLLAVRFHHTQVSPYLMCKEGCSMKVFQRTNSTVGAMVMTHLPASKIPRKRQS